MPRCNSRMFGFLNKSGGGSSSSDSASTQVRRTSSEMDSRKSKRSVRSPSGSPLLSRTSSGGSSEYPSPSAGTSLENDRSLPIRLRSASAKQTLTTNLSGAEMDERPRTARGHGDSSGAAGLRRIFGVQVYDINQVDLMRKAPLWVAQKAQEDRLQHEKRRRRKKDKRAARERKNVRKARMAKAKALDPDERSVFLQKEVRPTAADPLMYGPRWSSRCRAVLVGPTRCVVRDHCSYSENDHSTRR